MPRPRRTEPKPLQHTIHVGIKCMQDEQKIIDAMIAVANCRTQSNLLRRALAYYADVLEVDLPAGVFEDLEPGKAYKPVESAEAL